MKDPWEPDTPAPDIQSELTRAMIVPDPVSDLVKQPEVNRKRQAIAGNVTEQIITGAEQPQPREGDSSPAAANLFQFSRENLVRGIIWAEILGKPKAKRGR